MNLKKFAILVLGLLALACVPIQADDQVKFEVVQIEKGQRTTLQVQKEGRLVWAKEKGGKKVLTWDLRIDSPEFRKFKKVKVGYSSMRAQLTESRLRLKFFKMASRVQLEGEGSSMLLEVTVNKFPGVSSREKSCVSENVLLTPAAPAISPPFPLGVFCQNKSKETLFTISFPEDVELVNSSIFEIEGKGEPWRTYNLGEIAGGKKTSLGSFEFAFKGNTFFYNLKFLPPDSAMSKNVGRDRTQFVQGAVGYSKYDMHGGVSNTSDSRALVSVSVPYYPVFKGVGMGGGLELSLPISKKEGNISHYEMSGYGIYSFEISPMFELRPKLGYLKLNFENESTGEGISGGQLAVGLMSEIFLDNGLAFTLDLTTLKLLSKVFKSHFSVNVKVVKNTKSSLGYGAGIKYQSFKGPASNGSDLNMSQLVLQGIVLF